MSSTQTSTKTIKLDPEELQILRDFENGLYIPSSPDRKQALIDAARDYIRTKNKSITIRMSTYDINRLKARATKRGIKYQTLLTTLTRQFLDEEIEVKL